MRNLLVTQAAENTRGETASSASAKFVGRRFSDFGERIIILLGNSELIGATHTRLQDASLGKANTKMYRELSSSTARSQQAQELPR